MAVAAARASLASVQQVRDALAQAGYLADEGLATAVFLSLSLKRPLLLEGEAGVGKTELAKVLATLRGSELIRLQCYEGIDASQAVYDWDYSRQLLHLRAAEASGEAAGKDTARLESELYDERFLVRRALLRAIEPRNGAAPVLLVDEIDRADERPVLGSFHQARSHGVLLNVLPHFGRLLVRTHHAIKKRRLPDGQVRCAGPANLA